MTKPLSPFLTQCLARVHQGLSDLFLDLPAPSIRLRDAMQYSSLAGGKRIRALLVYATGHAFNIPLEHLDTPAIAVELIHTYSLIHDDLPAMDNDDMRRGKPTCHKAFDEATAILAGDALQTLAFEILAKPHAWLTPTQQLGMIQVLTQASGLSGMAGGQALDLASIAAPISIEALKQIHQLKTGALISACIQMALLAGNISKGSAAHMHLFAQNIGLAFQIQDDLLDVLGDAQNLGKQTGRDAMRDKPNYPALMGIVPCQQLLSELMHEAFNHLHLATPQSLYLQELTELITTRTA